MINVPQVSFFYYWWDFFFSTAYDELFTCYGRECTSSTFTTPNFPSPYPTNYRALFLIFVPGGEEITFQLGFPYDIGPGDFLYLGRGLDFTEADLLRPSISGEFYAFGTDDGTFRPFTLLGDAFWMYFVSDGGNPAGAVGFGILWTARMSKNIYANCFIFQIGVKLCKF